MNTTQPLDLLIAELRANAAFPMKRDIERAARTFGPKGTSLHARAHPKMGRDVYNGDDAVLIERVRCSILIAPEATAAPAR
jgi:hypothetical protein